MQPVMHRKVALMVHVNGKCHFKEISVVKASRALQEKQVMDRLIIVFGDSASIEIIDWVYIS